MLEVRCGAARRRVGLCQLPGVDGPTRACHEPGRAMRMIYDRFGGDSVFSK